MQERNPNDTVTDFLFLCSFYMQNIHVLVTVTVALLCSKIIAWFLRSSLNLLLLNFRTETVTECVTHSVHYHVS